ncbi:hypothetical protein ACFQL1_09935 [Halomicroarcula sp. GCM10025709]|uniref:DUF7139 domain-containing protein n=1 Tax=Halomicroarcula sp. GCM10025709 TaxID=3252669 RepID=UPI00360BDD4B
MENLGDAYGGRRWNGRDPRRIAAGVVLGVAGVGALVTAILVVTTSLSAVLGVTDVRAAEKLAGVLGGLGIPALFLSVVAVLLVAPPATRRRPRERRLSGRDRPVRPGVPGPLDERSRDAGLRDDDGVLSGMLSRAVVRPHGDGEFPDPQHPRRDGPPGAETRGRHRDGAGLPEEYKRYARAVRGDGGETEQVVQELRSRTDDDR